MKGSTVRIRASASQSPRSNLFLVPNQQNGCRPDPFIQCGHEAWEASVALGDLNIWPCWIITTLLDRLPAEESQQDAYGRMIRWWAARRGRCQQSGFACAIHRRGASVGTELDV